MSTTTTKEQVLDFFQTDRTHETGLNLYMRTARPSRGLLLLFNLSPSPERTDKLFYELAKAVGLEQHEWRPILRTPPEKRKAVMKADKNPKAGKGHSDAHAVTEVQKQQAALQEVETIFRENQKAAAGHVLLADFPFLSDESTPEEIQALESEKLTEWYRLQAARADLFEAVTDDQYTDAARRAIASLEANQDIWDELVAYRDTGRPLYKVPQLAWLKFKDEVTAKTDLELPDMLASLRSQMSQNKDNPDKVKTLTRKKEYVEAEIERRRAAAAAQ